MPAAQKLLVDLLVAAAAIARRQSRIGNQESVMIFPVLPRRRLVALQAVDAFLCVLAHLIFMNHRILQPRVTLRTLSRGPHKGSTRLFGFYSRPCTIDEKRSQD